MLELLLMMPGEPGGTPDHAQILCSYWTTQDNGASSLARSEARVEAGAGSSMDTTWVWQQGYCGVQRHSLLLSTAVGERHQNTGDSQQRKKFGKIARIE